MLDTPPTGPSFRFINETSDQSQQRGQDSSTKRQIVRSQAMTEVRRQQRLDAKLCLRLKWKDPLLGSDNNREEGPSVQKAVAPGGHGFCEYDFVTETYPGRKGSTQDGSRETAGEPETNAPRNHSDTGMEKAQQNIKMNKSRHGGAFVSGSFQAMIEPDSPMPDLPLDGEIYELDDQYALLIPILMHGTGHMDSVQKSLYHLGLNDVAACHAILAYSARHLDSLHGMEGSERALRHTIAAVRAINDKLGSGTSQHDDATVFSAALLAITERRFGCRVTAKQHWLGLKEIIAQRGGLDTLRANRALEAMVTWTDLVWSKFDGEEGFQSLEWPSLIAITRGGPNEQSSQQEFLKFLDHLDVNRAKQYQEMESWSDLVARRRRLFAQDSLIHDVLAPPSQVETQQKSQTPSACQIPCLLYLWLVLSNYAGCPEKETAFLSSLEACMLEVPRASLSPEHLLISLLIGLEGDFEAESQRAHKVMRLAHMYRMLDEDGVSIVHERLWRSLSMPGGQTDGLLADGKLGCVREQMLHLSGVSV